MKKYHATILLVDDDVHYLELVEKAFRKVGVVETIQKVYDGEQAIAYMDGEGIYANRIKYEFPTFIMIDLKMHRADGFTVLQHINARPEWAIVPTVVFSASADLDDIKKAYMLGASSYHVKPDTPVQLQDFLKRLHDYWLTCEVPQVDEDGIQVPTHSVGKLGERFPQITSLK